MPPVYRVSLARFGVGHSRWLPLRRFPIYALTGRMHVCIIPPSRGRPFSRLPQNAPNTRQLFNPVCSAGISGPAPCRSANLAAAAPHMIRSKFVLLSLACLTVAVCAQRSVAADEQFQGENPSETQWLTPESPHTQESWLCRPISAGLFVGMISGSPLIEDWVGQKQGLFGGLQLGYDGGDHWGTEFRLGFSSIELTDSARARAEAGVGSGPTTRYADLFLWDIGLLYYPCGDTAWRPYAKVGLGTGRIRFTDALHTRYNKISGAMPLALGLKYRCNDWMALRFECADNIVFGRGSVRSVHNFSITGGVEIRFGRSRKTYWPWNPDRSLL
jgi:hypothetical protein